MDVELRIQENMYLQCFCGCEKYDDRMALTLHVGKTRLVLLRIRMKRPRLSSNENRGFVTVTAEPPVIHA